MKLSIVIPVLNMEDTIEEAVKRVRKHINPYEILLLWDITKPKVEDRVKKLSTKLNKQYQAKTHFRYYKKGFGSALRLGFKKARGDVVVVTMGDLCDDYNTILKMMKKIDEGYDVVAGCRYVKGGGIIGNTMKQRVSKYVSVLVSLFSTLKCRDVTNAFKAYRKTVLEKVKTSSNSFDISFELTVKAAHQGFRVGQVPTVWKNRDIGQSSFNVFGESRSYLKWFLYAVTHNPSGMTVGLLIFLVIVLVLIAA